VVYQAAHGEILMRTQNAFVALFALTVMLLSCSSFATGPRPSSLFIRQAWMFESITFEIAPITSASPDPRALDLFRNRLHENHFSHRDRIDFRVRRNVNAVSPGAIWDMEMLRTYESHRRFLFDDDPTDSDLNVFVAYIDGPWLDETGLRLLGGIQYSPSAFAIFKTGAIGREESVLLHEFGHLIGLVNVETCANHDSEHSRHCVNQSCAMFYTAPGRNADFDPYCKREIARLIQLGQNED